MSLPLSSDGWDQQHVPRHLAFLGSLFGILRHFPWAVCGESLVQKSLPVSDSFFDWNLQSGQWTCLSERLIVTALPASRNVNRFEIPTAMPESFEFKVHLPKVSVIIVWCISSALGVKPKASDGCWASALSLSYIPASTQFSFSLFQENGISPLLFAFSLYLSSIYIIFFPCGKDLFICNLNFFLRKRILGQDYKFVSPRSGLHFYVEELKDNE